MKRVETVSKFGGGGEGKRVEPTGKKKRERGEEGRGVCQNGPCHVEANMEDNKALNVPH